MFWPTEEGVRAGWPSGVVEDLELHGVRGVRLVVAAAAVMASRRCDHEVASVTYAQKNSRLSEREHARLNIPRSAAIEAGRNLGG